MIYRTGGDHFLMDRSDGSSMRDQRSVTTTSWANDGRALQRAAKINQCSLWMRRNVTCFTDYCSWADRKGLPPSFLLCKRGKQAAARITSSNNISLIYLNWVLSLMRTSATIPHLKEPIGDYLELSYFFCCESFTSEPETKVSSTVSSIIKTWVISPHSCYLVLFK